MQKVLYIAWKDLVVRFRDPGALVLMLVTPFALTLAIAFAFGGLSGGGSTGGLADIPVAVVNHDDGELGRALVDVFRSQDLAELLDPVEMADEATAQATVDADETAAAVVIPAGFSERIMPAGLVAGDLSGLAEREQAIIEIYANPTRPVSAGVVRGVVDQFVGRVAAGAAGGQVTVAQLVMNGLVGMDEVAAVGQAVGPRAGEFAAEADLIAVVDRGSAERQTAGFDWMAYMAPSMAILFLMFTVSIGGRSILDERDEGTLPRMLTTPTPAATVLAGKVFGIALTGLAQLGILITASGLIFGVDWGDPIALVVVTVALVAAATGWGLLIAAVSRDAARANAVGTALALVFAAAAGNFIPRPTLPAWLQTLSYVSPNAWGLEAYADLAAGASLAGLAVPVLALALMAAVLFAVSTLAFRRQYG